MGRAWLLVLLTTCLLASLLIGQEPKPADLLEEAGIEVSSGAAPRYVRDEACASCHPEIAESYLSVGMSRSFFRPRADRFIEDFQQNHFYHAPSREHYEMVRAGEELQFRRYQLDAESRPINVWEHRVDWILGSGHRSRTYLYQTTEGELFQLPVAWYSQTRRWGMAPGFDNPDHQGISRRVRRECMFCHNAYPLQSADTAEYRVSQGFIRELPQGIGCQRCHGPGAEHIELALKGELEAGTGAVAIVNPRRLESRLRRDVCYQCHLQPSVTIPRLARFGRGDYSYRPGQPLDDYLVFLDPREEGQARSERFEINHHPYRLEQSPCYLKSNGGLECLDCHDPHAKPPLPQRLERYRRVCLGCHEEGRNWSQHPGTAIPADGACVDCHMPQRRTQDVVQVVMTDHRIQIPPSGRDLLAPLQEKVPTLVEAVFLRPERAPQRTLGEIYRAVATLRTGPSAEAADHLRKMLRRLPLPDWEPYLELARYEMSRRRFRQAEAALQQLILREPDLSLAKEWIALCTSGRGDETGARAILERLTEGDSRRPDSHFYLARLLLARGEASPAVAELHKAIELRPNYADAWYLLGLAFQHLESRDSAAAAFRRTLEIQPSHSLGYLRLGRLLLDQGQAEEARRYWRHGAEFAAEPEKIREALRELESGNPEPARPERHDTGIPGITAGGGRNR